MCSLITVVFDHSDLVVKLQINDHSNQYWQYYPCIYFAWDQYQVNNYHTALANTKANTCLQKAKAGLLKGFPATNTTNCVLYSSVGLNGHTDCGYV